VTNLNEYTKYGIIASGKIEGDIRKKKENDVRKTRVFTGKI
jgi:hypothetical protein